MIPFFLFLIDRFSFLFRLLNVDQRQVRSIVGVKLLMDTRRNTLTFAKSQNSSNTFVLALMYYCLLGGLISFTIWSFPLVISMTIFHSFVLMMIIMILISDFSAVLLDTSDNTILLPRPVTSRTLLVARIVHILLYLLQIWASLVVVPVIVFFMKYSAAEAIVFLIATFLSVLLSVFFTSGIYLLLMRFATEEKLKTIINYAQIGMAIFFMGAYQFLPRMLDIQNLSLDFDLTFWSVLVPPMWMAALQQIFHDYVFDGLRLVLALLALGVPIYGLYVVTTALSPLFARRLTDLGIATNSRGQVTRDSRLWQKMASWVSRSTLEQAAFLFTSRMTSRDQKFKLKVYPAMGYTLIMMIVLLIPKGDSFAAGFESLQQSQKYFFILYLVFVLTQTACIESSFSDEFRSSWVFYSSPIVRPGDVISGAIKLILVKYFLPLYLFLSACFLAIWGTAIVPDIIVAFFNNLCIALITVLIRKKEFPFSVERSPRAQSGTFIQTLLTILICAVIGVTHYFIAKIPYGTLAMLLIAIALFVFLETQIRKISWTNFYND